jgi:hypothetical protein
MPFGGQKTNHCCRYGKRHPTLTGHLLANSDADYRAGVERQNALKRARRAAPELTTDQSAQVFRRRVNQSAAKPAPRSPRVPGSGVLVTGPRSTGTTLSKPLLTLSKPLLLSPAGSPSVGESERRRGAGRGKVVSELLPLLGSRACSRIGVADRNGGGRGGLSQEGRCSSQDFWHFGVQKNRCFTR